MEINLRRMYTLFCIFIKRIQLIIHKWMSSWH